MLLKISSCQVVNVFGNVGDDVRKIEKTAANHLRLESDETRRIIESEVMKHPTALFYRARAIVADEVNTNGDFFSSAQLKESFQSFIGVPFYTNHQNQDIENAKGKIVHAEWDDRDKSIYVIGFVDREAYPHICRGIEEEYMSGVSMGAINGQSVILMADGSEKAIEDVREGEEVITPRGNSGRVKLIHCEYLGKPMHKFLLRTYHKSPFFTEDHPILTIGAFDVAAAKKKALAAARSSQHFRTTDKTAEFVGQDGWRYDSYNSKFKEASNVVEGDHFLIPCKYQLRKDRGDPEFYYLVGAFVGDGYLQKNKAGEYKAVSFCLNKDEYKLASKLKRILSVNTDVNLDTDVVCEERNGLYFTIWDEKLASWLNKNIGTGSHNKRLKFDSISKDEARALLCGYIDTDGCIVKPKIGNGFDGVQISSCNQKLLEDLQSLLISLDSISGISSNDRHPSESSVVHVDTVEYTLSIGSNSSYLFDRSIKYAKVGYPHADIKAEKSFITMVDDKKCMACPVKKILVNENFKEPVYDLTVDGDESYIADGIAVHNCSVEYSLCSICHNKAASVDEYCQHIKYKKGKKFSGKAKDMITGEVKVFKDADVYEENYGIKFIELSAVGDPACKTCYIDGVIDNDDFLCKAARVQQNLKILKAASMEKQAGPQEIETLNQTLESLEQICITLIQNRQQIETEFASDLVNILSELQEFTDELVGAGFGQLGTTGGGMPGEIQGEVPGMPPEGGIPPAPESGIPVAPSSAMPVSQTVGAPGTVTGSPTQPFVTPPTAPVKPIASIVDRLSKISGQLQELINPSEENTGKASNLHTFARIILSHGGVIGSASVDDDGNEKINFVLDDEQKLQDLTAHLERNGFTMKMNDEKGADEMFRRTPGMATKQRKVAMKTLSDNWKEKEDIEGENQNSMENGIATVKGESAMKVEASRSGAPEVITEKQLGRQTQGYHKRDDTPRDEITQAQLDDKEGVYGHQDEEREVVTEEQLKVKRTDSAPEVITQKQLDPEREGVEKQTITQDQLESEGYKTGEEQDSITEDQLEKKPDDGLFWGRKAFSRVDVKTAAGHLSDVISKIAEAAVFCGATPNQAHVAVSDLIGNFNLRAKLLERITSDQSEDSEGIYSYASTIKYYAEKNLPVPPVSKEQVKNTIAAKLHVLVASDEQIQPETVIDVLDVIADNEDGLTAVVEAVEQRLQQGDEVVEESSKSQLRSALRKAVEKKAEEVEKLAEPKKVNKRPVTEASHKIVASYEEIGLTSEMIDAEDQSEAKKTIIAYVRGVSQALGKKLAGVTNVEVDGQKIDIRVQWGDEEGDEVSLSIPGPEDEILPSPGEIPAEGEIEGGNLDALAPPVEAAPVEAPMATTPMPLAKSKKNSLKKEAQWGGMSGGMMGGGMQPGAQGDSPEGMGGPMGEESPIQSLTEEEQVEDEKEKSTLGEQMMPGSICPLCGSTDTSTGRKDLPPGSFECSDCGANYSYNVMVEVLNPQEVYEEGAGEGEIKEPKLPEMPVAATVKLDKDMLLKLAESEQKNGHVCPACGMKDCKPIQHEAGRISYVCPSCETDTTKDIFVSKKDPSKVVMKIGWTLDPKKSFGKDCEGCKEEVKKFAARVKLAHMIKSSQTSEFPMANCIERIARRYGANAVAHFGPCKGKPLADCVCSQLEQFGLRKVKYLEKLSSVYSSKDPMDECLCDHIGQGYTKIAAESICKALKKKYATEADSNAFLMAFADEAGLDIYMLRGMQDAIKDDMAEVVDEFPDGEADIGEALPQAPSLDEETVTIELPANSAEDIKDQIEEAIEDKVEVVQGEPDLGSASDLEISEQTEKEPIMPEGKGENSMKKQAEKPKKVEDIEGNVEAGIPRSDATIGEEGANNIDVPLKKPDVPRSNAEMGQEGPENINPKVTLPDVQVDEAYMGDEASEQTAMPGIKNEIKGTVIAEVEIDDNGKIVHVATVPEHVEHMESEVRAGIPRGDAAQGNEGPDNIDVPAKDKPDVPRTDATMGNEGPDNINVKEEKVDVPTSDQAYMGAEKETQNEADIPANSVKELGTDKSHQAKRDEQMQKIAVARHQKAMQIAAQLLAERRIKKDDFDEVVEDLSKLAINRIDAFANRVYAKPVVEKQASADVMTVPVIQESEPMTHPTDISLSDKLSDVFTIGNKGLNDSLVEDGTR